MRKTIIFIVAVAFMAPMAIVVTPDLSFAERGGGYSKKSKNSGREKMFKKLKMTDQQREHIRKMKTESRKKMVHLRADMEIKVIEFHEELQNANPDKTKTDKLIDEIANLRANMEKRQLKDKVRLMSILTPEQKTMMIDAMSKSMMGGHGGSGRPRH